MIKILIKEILSRLLFWQGNTNTIYVFIDQKQVVNYPDYIERSRFYLADSFKVIQYKNNFHFYLCLVAYGPHRVIFSAGRTNKYVIRIYFLNVDYYHNPSDGWDWHEALNKLRPVTKNELDESKRRFLDYYSSLKVYDSSLILGTGPSLAKATKLIDLESYKIACNTIVKVFDLWTRLKPHFIVAGDAIYHFGHTQYAKSFRKDLKKCLDAQEALFIYPLLYHPFVKEEFKDYSHLLIPIPTGKSAKLNNDLLTNFELPALGNVLNLLLLPLATTLSKKIYLLGFDGRAPDDKLFWSNSSAHSYGEYIPDIQKKHPQFFDYFIDDKNPFKYVNTVHGDVLDDNLAGLERAGYEFISLAPSYTKTIQKRYRPVFHLD